MSGEKMPNSMWGKSVSRMEQLNIGKNQFLTKEKILQTNLLCC